MRKRISKIFFGLFFVTTMLYGQNTEITRLIDSEFKMTFPSIYFKHNSTDYADMPYTVESCFKYIAANIKNVRGFVIWRDSCETDQLTKKRMEKIKNDLKKYAPTQKIDIRSMGEAQKISRYTIQKGTDNKQMQYLLSLNSVLDVSGTIDQKKVKIGVMRRIHAWYCPHCKIPR